ncbi:MAG: hypothetical protein A3H06_02130 [Candidatus Colwellbacteria bacterium RIFCSPLOWO2_12_FULL_44_13]|uniref:Uncharacterized protein n=3 Tax=Candidatus Colwelliibacteriota TaxID=1817904 RepID=A0A1G1Z6R0_9BACT|nr:MAG: hypothetical protein A3F24_01870 [Candidatus Colwellbacteria bacterium RIFCSPHIGHO2_12_FULL_44_17]OGY59357.1 MAG: hypothetical protein A3I31_01845 [Candidatus Colwellbacteria bacterium RIFCSPLOWO2_02_FULL_44_20b]OGY61224.1 MAG: hypothetical protein A3H06_02130 [Candidatus Colwellbacteria bacterium RIFCSPLOWO2_12_FULL_44_13]
MCHNINKFFERIDDPIKDSIYYSTVLAKILQGAGWEAVVIRTDTYAQLHIKTPDSQQHFKFALVPCEAVAGRCETDCPKVIVNYDDLEAFHQGNARISPSVIVNKVLGYLMPQYA